MIKCSECETEVDVCEICDKKLHVGDAVYCENMESHYCSAECYIKVESEYISKGEVESSDGSKIDAREHLLNTYFKNNEVEKILLVNAFKKINDISIELDIDDDDVVNEYVREHLM